MGKSTRLLIGVGASVIFIGGYFVMATVMGAQLGEPCDKEWGCKGLDAYCLEGDDSNMCSHSCESSSDCPEGYECAPITVWTLDGKSPTPGESTDQACLPQAPAAAP